MIASAGKREPTRRQAKQELRPTSSYSEKDVVVVVGGEEFHENSHILKAYSEYFGGSLRSGTKESRTKRFEFPDRDPKEWTLIMSLLDPFDKKTKLRKDNVFTALSWFDEFSVTKGLHQCDRFLVAEMIPCDDPSIISMTSERVSDVLLALEKGVDYKLPLTKARSFQLLRAILAKRDPLHPGLDDDRISKMLRLIEADVECRMELGDALESMFVERYIPAYMELGSVPAVMNATRVLNLLSLALQYKLARTKSKCFEACRELFAGGYNRLLLVDGFLERVCKLMLHNEECRFEMWSSLEQFLSRSVPNKTEQDVLLTTGVLPGFIRNQVQLKEP